MRRRTVRVNMSRDARDDDVRLDERAHPWIAIDFRLHYPPGTSRLALLQAIGDAAVRACNGVMHDETTTGAIGPVVRVERRARRRLVSARTRSHTSIG